MLSQISNFTLETATTRVYILKATEHLIMYCLYFCSRINAIILQSDVIATMQLQDHQQSHFGLLIMQDILAGA
jgi:hypothetical protein